MRIASFRRKRRPTRRGRVILIHNGQLVSPTAARGLPQLDNLTKAAMLTPSGVAAAGKTWINRPN
jgi:hypothetical protein